MAMAIPPTIPPLMPAEYGWIAAGIRTRWPPSPRCRRATVWNCVCTGAARRSGGSTGTASCFSTGRTSRHQPTRPRRKSTSPTTLTTRCVTSPAHPSVIPSAVTRGQTVDAGMATVSGAWGSLSTDAIRCLAGSTTDNVDHEKDDNPDDVDKMPIQRQHCDALTLRQGDIAPEAQDQHQRQQYQAYRHMHSVEPHQRVKRRPKEVRADGQMMHGDQPVPLERGSA